MCKNIRVLFMLSILFCLGSCSKEEFVNVLQDKYDPVVKEPEFTGEDFIVNLNARSLQTGEKGEWKILAGTVVESFVYFEDKTNPFTRFKGLPGEGYTLEWKRWDVDGNAGAVQVKVKIPELMIEIADSTPAEFETIRLLAVNPRYRGVWSIEGAYGFLNSRYHDGLAEPPEKKPSIELHAYANTSYTAIYKYTYAGKVYEFRKVIKTGNYTEDEGLYELQLSRGDSRITEDKTGRIIELNLQASGIAWIFSEAETYPALKAFTKLRKLIFGGSSLHSIAPIFGDHYLDLEELDLGGLNGAAVFPENFGKLTKLKTLFLSPRFSVDPNAELVLPKSFANLKALESFTTTGVGSLDFNGTLGSLTNLKTLKTPVTYLPEDIGNLKELEHLDVFSKNTTFPKRFSECKSLTFARLYFTDYYNTELILSPRIGDLKKLEYLDITSKNLRRLPDTFSELSALKILKIAATNLQSIPENFGNLSSLEDLNIYGMFTRIPNSFGRLSKLSVLFLGGRAATLPESFGDLSSLTYFNAESSKLKALPGSIGKLKKLKELSLALSEIDVLPASFSELDALEKLNLSQTKLKTFPRVIIPLKSINQVLLSGTNTGDIPDDFSNMKAGVMFYFYQVPNLTYDHFMHILNISRGKIFYTNFGYYSTAT